MRFCYFVAIIASLSAVTSTFDLRCAGPGDVLWNKIGSPFVCIARGLNITQKCEWMTSSSGNDIDQVTTLLVREQTVHYVPKFSRQLAQRLEVLEIWSCSLKSIKRSDLQQIPNLKSLELLYNDFDKLDSDLFESTPKIESINFQSNKLTSVGVNILLPLKNLKSAIFYDSGCIDDRFARTSADLRALKSELKLNCRATDATNETTRVSEDENCAERVDFACAPGKSRNVCVAKNLRVDLPTIEVGMVRGIGNERNFVEVTELVIEGQLVNFLPHQLARTFPKLQKLVVSYSKLTSLFETEFFDFAHLKWIEICNNNITSIDAETFNAVPQVEHLDLSSNHIQSLPSNVFKHLTQLQKLILSFNDITTLKADIFPPINAIKVFKIDNNIIEVIDPEIFQILANADEIDFSLNYCIGSAYLKSDKNSANTLRMLFENINLSCSPVE